MGSLNHGERDLHEQSSASDDVVATTTVKEGIDPVRALSHRPVSPVLPEPGRHPQTDVAGIWVRQAVPQRDADVVGFDFQLVKRGELGCWVCRFGIKLGEPAEPCIEGKLMRAPSQLVPDEIERDAAARRNGFGIG